MAVKPFIKALTFLKEKYKNFEMKTIVVKTEDNLRKFIYDTIPDNSIVGIGNCLAQSRLKIRDILLEKGIKVYNSWSGPGFNRSLDTFDELPRPDYFLTSAEITEAEGSYLNVEFPENAPETDLPEHIIAFSMPSPKSGGQPIIIDKPETIASDIHTGNAGFTLVVVPFMKAS
ncbi:MAG: hypothetical protein JXB34_05605 [Bacteroidales bacterium]|nr:hypothetical protein [Bacteroidales bacterium]